MKNAKFISIEGIEGAGKSTALQYVREYLVQSLNLSESDMIMTREPGGTPLAEEIRNILLHPHSPESMAAQTELLLMFACRAQHLEKVIKPALHANQWVISDRYIDASYAYQHGGRGLSLIDIQKLDELVVNHFYPHLTLLLDLPSELGLQRTEKRGNAKDRIEQERCEFFTRVRDYYLIRQKEAPTRIKIIDASLDLEAVQNQIKIHLDQFLGCQP